MISNKIVLSLFALILIIVSCQALPVSVHQEVIEAEEEPDATMEPEPVQVFSLASRLLGTSFKINCAGDAAAGFTPDFYQWSQPQGVPSSYYNDDSEVIGNEEVPSFVFKSHRYGLNKLPWSYNLPLETAGTYSCTLYFAESFLDYQVIGGRIFKVSATGNGETQIEDNIDIFAETGGDITKYIERTFLISATDTITFYFESIVAEAMVSAVSCDIVA